MKPSRHLKRLLKNESAQALVETVIVLPVVIFFILGTIQLTLMHQARLMLEYAAFNAARTGSVWNGDVGRMRRAATLSLIATRVSWPVGNDWFSSGSIQSYEDLAGAALQNIILGDLNYSLLGLVGLPNIVNIDILSPRESDFEGDQLELDFDKAGESFSERRRSQLSIRVKYFYELFVPFANWIIWNGWLELKASKALGYANFAIWAANELFDTGCADGGLCSSQSPFLAFDVRNHSGNENTLTSIFSLFTDEMNSADNFEGLKSCEFFAIQAAAKSSMKRYYIPMVTSHTIKMQSNLYKINVEEGDGMSVCDLIEEIRSNE